MQLSAFCHIFFVAQSLTILYTPLFAGRSMPKWQTLLMCDKRRDNKTKKLTV